MVPAVQWSRLCPRNGREKYNPRNLVREATPEERLAFYDAGGKDNAAVPSRGVWKNSGDLGGDRG